jgi:hypothetical protein
MTVYNMKRTINILGYEQLMQKLSVWKPKYNKGWFYSQNINNKETVIATLFFETKMAA